MHTALYVIWFAIPTFFFLLALWSKLEQYGGRSKRDNPADLLKQGLFVLVCVFIAIGVDKTVLPGIADAIFPTLIPLGFYQVLLLPFILLVAAMVLGGSKSILIPGGGKPQTRSARKRR